MCRGVCSSQNPPNIPQPEALDDLLKTPFQAFKSGGAGLYWSLWYNLNKTIKKNQRHFHSELESEMDIRQLWQSGNSAQFYQTVTFP